MSSPWRKVKGLFWQSDGTEAPAGEVPAGSEPTAGDELSDEDFAALLEGSPHAVPKEAQAEPVEISSVHLTTEGDEIQIDFQEQYDLAGIPDTDEVEQLENFLTRLDPSLPQVSKIAAAEAFLGAIGKDAAAVLNDAERKIKRVRGILVSKEEAAQQAGANQQAAIESLQKEIEAHKTRIQEINGEVEGVRRACLKEESRLQAARIFFGNVGPAAAGGTKP